jgi:hypothetical protein
VSESEEEIDSRRRSQSISVENITKQSGRKMYPLIMFALQL